MRGVRVAGRRGLLVAGVAVSSLVAAGGAAAAAVSPPLAAGFAGPLQIAVGADARVYVAQDFAGALTRVNLDGSTTDLVSSPGDEIAGVDIRKGKVTFTTSSGEGAANPFALLKRWYPNGRVGRSRTCAATRPP